MKKIGTEKRLLSIGENNPRNGEGAFLRLKDGRILYAYTKFVGVGGDDHDTACIAAVYSSDEGETWSEDRVLYEKPAEAANIGSVSLLRMANGDLGLIFLRKDKAGDRLLCIPYLYRSRDEGESFDSGTRMISEPSYYVLNNDRVIRLSSGRILFAACDHVDGLKLKKGVVKVYASDDDALSFQKISADIESPFETLSHGLMEPGLFELPDGRIWLYIRTGFGYQYESFSDNGGETFTSPEPNYRFTSPASPMLVKNAGKYTLAVLNPAPISGVFTVKPYWAKYQHERTPYVCAVSCDGGLSFVGKNYSQNGSGLLPLIRHCFFVEDDTNESYCYPAIYEVKDGFLVSYYFSNGSGKSLACGRITKVSFAELGL